MNALDEVSGLVNFALVLRRTHRDSDYSVRVDFGSTAKLIHVLGPRLSTRLLRDGGLLLALAGLRSSRLLGSREWLITHAANPDGEARLRAEPARARATQGQPSLEVAGARL